jgi:hypothetical protein
VRERVLAGGEAEIRDGRIDLPQAELHHPFFEEQRNRHAPLARRFVQERQPPVVARRAGEAERLADETRNRGEHGRGGGDRDGVAGGL